MKRSRTVSRFFLLLIVFLHVGQLVLANGSLIATARTPAQEPLALTERKAFLQYENGLVQLDVEDTFMNPNKSRLEGVYRFSLPPGGFVTQFAIMTDEKEWADGKIMEVAQARFVYEEIVRREIDPGLLEQHGNEVILKVFPIEPEKTVKIRIRAHYASVSNGKSVKVPLPLEIPSVPKASEGTVTRWTFRNGRPEIDVVPTVLKISGTCVDNRGLAGGKLSPNGSCEMEKDKLKISSETKSGGPLPVSLTLELKTSPKFSLNTVKQKTGESFWMARVSGLPEPAVASPRYALIVDGSGSMGGKNCERAQRMLDAIFGLSKENGELYLLEEGKIQKVKDPNISARVFHGPIFWEVLETLPNVKDFDGFFIITDGDGLSPYYLKNLWKELGYRPIWVLLVNEEIPYFLQAVMNLCGGAMPIFTDDQQVGAKSRIKGILKDFTLNPRALSSLGQPMVPLFGRLSCNLPSEAFFVANVEDCPSLKIVDGKGSELLSLRAPETGVVDVGGGEYGGLFAKQQILTLEREEQTPEIIKRITKLGLTNNLASEYTAFLAVPEEIAKKYSNILNPAFLAAFAAPNFRKAREQSTVKACYANMRVIEGAIEMYNMDNSSMYEFDPDTCE